jgi:CubicO group peptidase (beta-lactamase class C family)
MNFKFYFFIFFAPFLLYGQKKVNQIIENEYTKGHFNGSILTADKDKVVKINKGYANFQFDVKINDNTRFPIASVSKLFTTIALIQLHEKKRIAFDDPIGKYIPTLPENCKNIMIKDLITHHSGLENEPVKAYSKEYKIDDYLNNFVKKSDTIKNKFNYNNVDFVILSKIIEKITQKKFTESIEELIFKPLGLKNTGFVSEDPIIKNLAYSYHNYTFGEGDKNAPLFNDNRIISNYYGAGGIYSTTEDLYKFLTAIKSNQLISESSKLNYIIKPQNDEYISWIGGKPTFGFYINDREKEQVLRRDGNIDGINASIIVNKTFDKILIILCNTDTADLEKLSKEIYITL